ncbi:MAG: hypothetical protein HZA08_05410 [Nitrospirae bacterium]|nr:hypothetical protein [Nitrospirota bacterium]
MKNGLLNKGVKGSRIQGVKEITISGAVFVFLMLFMFTGCGPKYMTSTISPKWKDAKITKVILIPFIASAEDTQKGLRSARIDPQGVAQVTSIFLHSMEKYGYTVIPYDDGTKEKLTSDGKLDADVIKLIRDKTGADAVLTGIITRFEEREGGPVGVKKPASVGFEVNLISTNDGTVLWKGVYAETQKPLLEDVSLMPDFIKRKGKWLTAEELTKSGAEKVLQAIQRAALPAADNNEREEKGY